jgi:hypothetical protein
MLQAEEWSTVLHGFCCIPHARRQRADGPLSLPPELFGISEQLRIPYKLEVTMDELKIGTPEAALASCVNLFSRLFNVPEDYARYYLDMYYQLRQQYEHQAEPEAAKKPKKARPAPAYPAPMRTMNEPKTPEAAADPPPAEVTGVDTSEQAETEADAGGGEPLPPPGCL